LTSLQLKQLILELLIFCIKIVNFIFKHLLTLRKLLDFIFEILNFILKLLKTLFKLYHRLVKLRVVSLFLLLSFFLGKCLFGFPASRFCLVL